MKKLVLFGLALSFGGMINAQTGNWCGFDTHQQKIYDENPGMEEGVYTQMSNIANGVITPDYTRSTSYTIPVVVHVIYDTDEGNISYAQIESMITALNADFSATNSGISGVQNTADAPFAPLIADVQMVYTLAKIDPNGDCTNGVERRYSPSVATNAGDNCKFYNSGGLDQWDRTKYLNIWVVENIDNGGGGGTIGGYAEFPYSGGSNTFGLVVRDDVTGTIGTSNSNRTVTHEIGHCFGLLHTFQGGCHTSNCSNNGDYICDTPPVSDPQWSCGTSQNTCTGVPAGDFFGFDAYDMYQNHMSYSPCRVMFTTDQSNLMHANMDGISFLTNLGSASNAIATGIDGPGALCVAEFTSTTTTICAGGTVTFDDISYFNVTGTDWTFDGGSPATSSSASPTVTYNTGGVYDVTLEVTDGSGSVINTKTAYVVVIADPGVPIPYSEGFETLSVFPDDVTFFVSNEDGGQAWGMGTGVGSTGTKYVKLANFGVTNDSKDGFSSGSIDLSTVDVADNLIISFSYAYRKRSSTNNENIRFYVSKDCGETWALRKNVSGNNLSSVSLTSPYTPADEAEWVDVEVTNVTSEYFVSNFRYKFEFTNDGGNNVYIDDINIYTESMLSIEEASKENTISVYPNPVNDLMQVKMNITEAGDYTITLVNVLGEYVANVYTGYIATGKTTLNYGTAELPVGIYFLKIESNGVLETRKVVKR